MKSTKGTKAAFLAAFGHGPDYHDRFGLFVAPRPRPADVIAWKRAAAADLPQTDGSCGWWWCKAPADSVPWSELEKAHKRLTNIDPHGPHVAELGNEYARVRDWAKERDPYEILSAALAGAKLPDDCDAAKLRRECLETIRQRHRHAMVARGEGKARKPLQAAITLGRSWGWDPPTIAAALALTGAEKPGLFDEAKPRHSGFAAVVRTVEAAAKRLK
jgi:hypothetical protein